MCKRCELQCLKCGHIQTEHMEIVEMTIIQCHKCGQGGKVAPTEYATFVKA